MRVTTTVVFLGLTMVIGKETCRAQLVPAEPVNTPAPQRGGFHLFSAMSYTGYTTQTLPNGDFNLLTGTVPLGADIQTGASASLGWTRPRPRSNISIIYSPSYTGMMRNSEWNALGHLLSFSASRKAGRKWDLGMSLNGADTNMNQFLFTPAIMSNLAATPASFEELTGAILSGRSTNEQLASVLTGAPVLESPARTTLYGNRVLSTAASISATYAHSARLSLRFGADVSRFQYLDDGQPSGTAGYLAIVPRTMRATAGLGFSYSLTPLTDFGLDANSSRIASWLQDAYVTNVVAFLGRKISRRWFVQVRGGTAQITIVRETYPFPRGRQPITAGNVGYKTPTQTFMVHGGRDAADVYGAGALYTLYMGGTWRWRRPGSDWVVSSSVRQQRIYFTGSQYLDGWLISAAVFRALSRQTGVQISYAYMNNFGMYQGAARDISVHAIQLAFQWTEKVARERENR